MEAVQCREYQINGLDELDQVAKQLLDDFKSQRLFLLEGDLGAGKTTLVQAICRQLHVPDEVVSPTYTLVNEYRDDKRQAVYHIDLYRLHDIDEAINIGIEDYIYSKVYTFIEWPDVVTGLLPPNFVKLEFHKNKSGADDQIRKLTATSYARLSRNHD